MKLSIPGQDMRVTITSDSITTEFSDGTQHTTPITPEFKRNAADTTAMAGGAVASGVGLGVGSTIASLGSIGVAGLGTAISIPLFPVIGVVAGVGAAAVGIAAAYSAAEAIDPS